ncbi:MAG: EamA family transporter RarD [Planctomycetota bacterium]
MSSASPSSETVKGTLAAGLCFVFWGLVPLYWRQLSAISPVELIAHRGVWSMVVLLALVVWRGRTGEVLASLRQPRALARNLLSSILLTTNWLVYLYGVNSGQVTECSLGYFLVPLVIVAVGRFVMREQLRWPQWIAVGSAAIGVLLLVIHLGGIPWIALSLAGSWAAYSFMRKLSPIDALTGLSVETILIAPLFISWLVWQHHTGDGALLRVDGQTHMLLFSAGVITAFPLLLFGYGAQRIRLATLGLMQYISPSIQLLLAVVLYGEPFSSARAVSFAFIWAGLLLYSCDNLLQRLSKSES